MNRRHIEALQRVGITKKNYYGDVGGFAVDYDDRSKRTGPAPCWGVELIKGGQRVALITQTPRGHGGDNKWYIRTTGWSEPPPRGTYGYPRQLDAVMAFIQQFYNISDAEVADARAQSRRAQLRAV